MFVCPKCDVDVQDPSLRFCSQCGHDLKPKFAGDEFDGLVGKIVDGRYKVLGRIGVGGMGIVYRVEHIRMGKVAAMKVLRRDLADDAQAAKRFVHEVEVVSKLEHPNIVQTFDFGEWHGLLYLVMELVRGEDLAVQVRRDGAISIDRALPLFVQVCQALDEAHHAGVIHRDLKPDNIVVFRRREGEHVKVLDFGLAKLREQAGLAEVTGAGSLVGTPYYMAPEQVRSEGISERTDIYALGATIYRVVTGVPVFQGETPMAILSRHLTDPVVPPSQRLPGLPLDLDHLLLKALSKDPANRFESAKAMLLAIENVLAARLANPEVSQSVPAWINAPNSGAGDSSSQSAVSAVTRVEVPASSDDSDPLTRLRKEDVDLFERRLRWRRRYLLMLSPLAFVGVLWAGWNAYRSLSNEASEHEVEPNDSAATATVPHNGAALFGRIGEPSADGTPDFDYYRIPGGKPPRWVHATVSGVANVDLVLELFDVRGSLVAKINGGGEGRGEALGPWKLSSGNDFFLRVRPLWLENDRSERSRQVTSSRTPYMLVAAWGKPTFAWELEPNDQPAQASPLSFDVPLQGHIATADDVDWFELSGKPGRVFSLELAAGGKQELQLESPSVRRRYTAASTIRTDSITMPTEGKISFMLREVPRKSPSGLDRTEPYTLSVLNAP